jgi:hypothetical protein
MFYKNIKIATIAHTNTNTHTHTHIHVFHVIILPNVSLVEQPLVSLLRALCALRSFKAKVATTYIPWQLSLHL